MNQKIPLFVTLFWTAITSLFLLFAGYGLINQSRALYFASTTGVVDSIRQTVSHGKSTTYGIDISYHYEVNGKRFDSTRVRFMQGSSTDGWSSSMLRQFPKGSKPAVYYNAGDPSEAVLVRGIQGEDLFLLLFLTPFTLVMVMMWVSTVLRWRKTKGFLGLRVTEMGEVTRIRPSGWMAVISGLYAMGLAAFVSIFVLGIPFGFHADLKVAVAGWVAVLGVAVAVGVKKYVGICRGVEDVVLDDGRKVFTGPKNVQVEYGDITGVKVKTVTTSGSKGQQSHKYEVWMHSCSRAGVEANVKLESWSEQEEETRRFAAWLGTRLGVEVEDMAS